MSIWQRWLRPCHCSRHRSLTTPLPPPPPLQDGFRNQGGFHVIGSGRDAIAKPEQLAAAEKVGT